MVGKANGRRPNLTDSLVKKLEPRDRDYDVRDGSVAGFAVRVRPSGKKSFRYTYARGKQITLGY